jgi:polyhydroxybutyrate depolymerase
MNLNKTMAAITCLIFLPACAPAYEPMEQRTFEHQGMQREYFVHVPEDARGSLPVIFAIHGYTSTATGFETLHDMNRHADENGYIVVYPQGSHFVDNAGDKAYRVTSWNMFGAALPNEDAGPQCNAGSYRYPCPPECGSYVLEAVESEFDTDKSRYYALGVSNGGMMTLRLGCDMADRFAAIAPIISQLPAGYLCAPQHDLPMLLLFGGKDEVVRFDGRAGLADGFIYESSAATAAAWATAMQCESDPAPWANDLTDRIGLSCEAYTSCKVTGQEVVSCLDPDETHNWPGKRPGGPSATCAGPLQQASMPEQQKCERRTDDAPHQGLDLVWQFFSRYARD